MGSNVGVSVVIPTYNAEDFISLQLEALLKSSVLPDEIIVSDNGSTDRTPSIVAEWEQKSTLIRRTDSSSQRGVSYARNLGCSQAEGKLLLVCDADDIVAPTWVEAMVDALADADLVGSGHQLLLFDEPSSSYQLGDINIQQPQVFEGIPYVLGASMGFKREVFEALEGFDLSYQAGHDEVDFCLRATTQGFQLGWVDKPLIHYRQRSSLTDLAGQMRNYGRTWVQLIMNFSPAFDHKLPGLKLMLRKVLLALPGYLAKGQRTREEIRGFWWNLGVLEGTLRYQVLRTLPQRKLK